MLKFQRGFVAVTRIPRGGSHVRVLGLLLARRRAAALREGSKVSAEPLALIYLTFSFPWLLLPTWRVQHLCRDMVHSTQTETSSLFFQNISFFHFRLGRWCFVAMFFNVILQTASFGGGCGESMGTGDEMGSAQDGVAGTRWGFPGAAERGIYPC